jgi:phosphonoacetate hydrolase
MNYIPPRLDNIICNGRSYALSKTATVVVCLDGSEPGYIEEAISAGKAPFFEKMMREGANLLADSVIPSFTNPNNLSIVTGRPPSVHGIAGNFFFDPATGEEVMMNDPKFLRAPTILHAAHEAGAKLRLLLSKDLDYGTGRAIAFSSERADKTTRASNGIDDVLAFTRRPLPDVYSADLSEFVFAAGVRLMEMFRPDLMYLSTTDYIQHKAGPGTEIANAFYGMIDGYLTRLDSLGAIIVATADHGMNDKHDPRTKQPNVVYLQTHFDAWLGEGKARVILPITDPYVVHHGALGSFATVHAPEGADIDRLVERIRSLDGIDTVLTKAEACARFELPGDRIGDIVVTSTRHMTLGTTMEKHDLSGLDEPLRSHGGLTEQRVPLIANRKLQGLEGRSLRNFDVFDVAMNHVA